MQGSVAVLRVDPLSDGIVDLYLPKDAWVYLVRRCGGNKMRVTLRGPHDVHRMTVEALIEDHGSVLDEIFGRDAE